MAEDPMQTIHDRIDAMSEELDARFDKALRWISQLEDELERKISDLEYTMSRVEGKIRDLERQAERGY